MASWLGVTRQMCARQPDVLVNPITCFERRLIVWAPASVVGGASRERRSFARFYDPILQLLLSAPALSQPVEPHRAHTQPHSLVAQRPPVAHSRLLTKKKHNRVEPHLERVQPPTAVTRCTGSGRATVVIETGGIAFGWRAPVRRSDLRHRAPCEWSGRRWSASRNHRSASSPTNDPQAISMSGETGRAGSDSPERAKSAELRRLMAQTGQSKKAELARQESFVERHPNSCLNMTLGFFWRRKCTLMLLVAACCALVVYCVPFIDVQPEVPDALPQVPFNFKQGPLSASQPQLIKVQHFFVGLMRGPESLAIDSTGSIYMAVEGGFVLQARLNATPTLTKIAELNPIRTASQERRMQSQHATARRECQLDEKLYGAQNPAYSGERGHPFSSHISISRCSKPLGLRLSNDEAYLYIVDTLEGLYRVSLRVADKANPSQRLVTKLINFQINRSLLLPIHQADQLVSSSRPAEISPLEQVVDSRPRRFINVTLRAVDDLLIDPGAGTRGADLIYLSDASQRWQATSFFFDLLEGRPSGVILRYDTGSNQLSVLNPSQVAHVRTSTLDLINSSSRLYTPVNSTSELIFPGIGAPRLNEDDVFDDRPLFFPNGLEMTEDRQALLITDTSNKRIIKHYIRGPRVGTSDHWAWTPNFPDNIRRGAMKNEETYWVVGCGEDNTDKFDVLAWLRDWPSLRKYILKNIYFVGATLETLGANLGSSSIRDAGFALKTGDSLSERACQGMMILQYNKYGDIIRSVYSPHFPNDLVYYSQVNEVIDAENNEHVLYLGSPAYSYITKLVLPALASEPASNEVPS